MIPMTRVAVAAVLAAAVSGCLPSLYPVHTEDSKIELPAIHGKWQMLDENGKVEIETPWVFGDGEIEAPDSDGVGGTLEVAYFKVGKNVFLDTAPDEAPEGSVSEWWHIHAMPIHMVSKVDLSGDKLVLTPMHYGHVTDAVEKGAFPLKHLPLEDDGVLFVASPEEWKAFLAKQGGDTNVFSAEMQYRFKRVE